MLLSLFVLDFGLLYWSHPIYTNYLTLSLTPAKKWVAGRFAQAYHRFIRLPHIALHLKRRRTSVEPLFDLITKVIATNAHQKQLPVQRLDNVRTCLALATLSVQISMIANSIWSLPHRNISQMATAFT